jgi:hypothetical protein
MNRIALALTIAAISTGAAAQQPLLNDPLKDYLHSVMKPYEAKTNPDVPIAPAQPVAPVQSVREPLLAPGNSPSSNSLLDGCVMTAIGRLPKAEGLRVTGSTTEFRSSWRKFDFYNVVISAELNGRNGTYQWICRVFDNQSAELIANR